MADTRANTVLHHLQQLVLGDRTRGLADPQLLQQFICQQDAAAFEALVQRHGPMVLSVCRAVLHHEQEAEDVFQATFLLLARKAGSIRKQSAVGSWLHGVAYRLARKAQTRAARRSTQERRVEARPSSNPADDLTWRELRAVLHDEIQRLPEKYRVPLLLCYWEAKTRDEAAQQLQWSRETLKDRLERARALLRARLTRRGLTPSVALFAGLLTQEGTAAVPAGWVAMVVQTAPLWVAGTTTAGIVSPRALALAEGAVKAMQLTKWLTGAALLFVLAVLAAGMSLAPEGSADPPPEPARPIEAAREQPEHGQRTDQYGDPLPPGAIARLGTVRFRQGSVVSCLDLSPDGKTVISGDGKVLRLWDLATGKELRQYLGHGDSIGAVAFSPDGKWLASGACDRTVRLWQTDTGKELRRLQGHEGHIDGVAFSPNGKTLASGSIDSTIHLWDLTTDKEVRLLRLDRRYAPKEFVVERISYPVFFAPDGKTLISRAWKGTIRRWNAATGAALPPILAADHHRKATALSPDGKRVATSSPDGIHLWDLGSGREVRRIASEEARMVDGLVFSPDGARLASSSWDCKLRLWDVATGKLLGRLEGHRGNCYGLRFAPDGKTLVTGGWDHTLRAWDVARGKELHSFSGLSRVVYPLNFSADGQSLVSVAEDGTFRRWQAATGKELPPSPLRDPPGQTLAFSPDRTTMALVGYEQPTEAEKDAFLKELAQERMPRSWIPSLVCTTIQLRDLRTGQLLHAFGRSFNGVQALVFSADGKLLAAGSREGIVRVWDTGAGKEVRQLGEKQPAQTIYHLAFSPDAKTLVTWQSDRFRTWDVATGKLLCKFGAEVNFVYCLAFAPDGKAVITGSRDEPICFWDPRRGKKLRELTGHRGAVNALAFSPNGKMLASAGEDRTVRLWELATDQQRLCFTGHRGGVGALVFSPDGRWLASGSSDTTALVWDVSGRKQE